MPDRFEGSSRIMVDRVAARQASRVAASGTAARRALDARRAGLIACRPELARAIVPDVDRPPESA
jgi:hypothetical protein